MFALLPLSNSVSAQNNDVIYSDENIGFTMIVSSTGATITSAYDPAITALTVTVSDVTINVNRSSATSSNPAYATMNWKATETQSGIVVSTSYCYLRVYMNNVRQLRMEWYA